MMWTVTVGEDGTVHVMPLDDVTDHVEDGCVCGPETEAVFRPDGTSGWMVTHHSLDGREQDEG